MDASPPPPHSAPTRRLVVGWLPAVVWAGLIFALSAQPGLTFVPDEGLDLVVRKLGHMGIFGILALLLWRALATTTRARRPWPWALGLAALYALSDELHQAFTAGRSASLVDVGIDAVGALIAVGVVLGARAIRSRRRRARAAPAQRREARSE